jgi:phospholipid-binding lipoprotein MlaA
MDSRNFTLLPLCALLLFGGCATQRSGERNPLDPFERFNRSVFRFNQNLDRTIARPIAVAYTKVAPQPVRSGVANFLDNLSYPTVVVNDLLQAKPTQFAHDTARLVVNTTLGIGGLFNPASKLGLDANDEDFGQTLGRWGVPQGPYLMLPVLGPSSIRDAVGKVGDHYTEPKTYISSQSLSWGLTGATVVSKRASLLEADAAFNRYFDPYSFVRNAYLQRREFQVYDGNPPEDPLQEYDPVGADQGSEP